MMMILSNILGVIDRCNVPSASERAVYLIYSSTSWPLFRISFPWIHGELK
jgi:hypothetical protein